ncbi:MAG: hypothetical protein AAF333_00955 [Planctomycetota bacterium]
MKTKRLLLALPILGFTAAPALGQIILSDSFDRTLGSPGDPDAFPPVFAETDWGMTDNGLGGTVGPINWIPNPDVTNPDFVNGSQGILQGGRAILDYNLATDPDIVAAQGFAVQFDVSPDDSGGTEPNGQNGRDWLGFFLADTNNEMSLGGAGALAPGGNADSRFGVAPRNSGSLVSRRFLESGVVFNADGMPDADTGINEPIFDQSTFDAYVAWFNGGDGTDPGDPVDDFVSAAEYTVRVEFTPAAGETLFAAGAEHNFVVSIGDVGGTLSPIDLDPTTGVVENTFVWGDNATTAVSVPDEPVGDKAFISFASFGFEQAFDNLIIEALGGDPGGLIGDFSSDDFVGQADLDLVLANFGATVLPGGFNAANTTGGSFDGLIGQNELDDVLNNFGNSGAPAATAIPEPTSAVLAGLGGLTLLRRRRFA